MRSLVFILLLGAAVALEDDKIVGGYECTPYSQPWQVSLNSGERERGVRERKIHMKGTVHTHTLTHTHRNTQN
ncbi:hypothetical protein JZ751_007454 [Albula glossodonta]|uniref:Secreted protein n=1 Tax=Albula glossodonta TaxID=121402 RepID=A0A8T2N7N2_9TELE|nr:hypothetical protein JZ751_007454 [Albula glossodonta]